MRNKLLFITGVGIGYVLGTKAGRERYEQIRRAAKRVKDNPTVQEATGVIQAQASGLATSAKNTVGDKLGHTAIGAKVTSLLGSDQTGGVTPTPTPGNARPAGSNGVAPLS